MKKRALILDDLKKEAVAFAELASQRSEPLLFGVTDGKAVGTHLELGFRRHLALKFTFQEGNAAKGVDFPGLNVDMKTTSTRQPQSSCPFKSARQKVYGLGYSLLIFVYEKFDDHKAKTGRLDIRHVIYVLAEQTGDFQTTAGLRAILEREGNQDDVLAFLAERHLPLDEVGAETLAKEIMEHTPPLGYLTVSNALQWRLQYARAIEKAGSVEGVLKLR